MHLDLRSTLLAGCELWLRRYIFFSQLVQKVESEGGLAMRQGCIPCCKRVRPATDKRESPSVFWILGLSHLSTCSFFGLVVLSGPSTALILLLTKEDVISSNCRFDGTVIGTFRGSSVLRSIGTPISHSTTEAKTHINMP